MTDSKVEEARRPMFVVCPYSVRRKIGELGESAKIVWAARRDFVRVLSFVQPAICPGAGRYRSRNTIRPLVRS
jgi:hypothetical protein